MKMRQLTFITLIIISFTYSTSYSTACFAEDKFTVEGTVTTESGQPIDAVNILVNDEMVLSNKKGYFSIILPSKDIYQLQFEKKGYYKSIHSYSHFELMSSDKSRKLTDVTLVAKKKERVMLAFGGDVMMGRRFYKPYFNDPILIHQNNKLADSKAIVKFIKPYMSLADHAAVNLESQISEELPGERAPKSVTFYSRPELLDALTWAGIDYVTLGNNHTFDYMTAGLTSTLAFLNKSELGFSGAGFNETEALLPYHKKINDVQFSMLGYVGWQGGSNPTQTANDEHGGAAYGSMDNMLGSIHQEIAQDKVVIAQYHGSQEYANNPTMVTEHRLKSSLDAGATLAIAHHPHVTQGLELHNGKLIAYSMGNFIFDQNFSATQHSFILYVWLDGDTFHRAEIVPLYNKAYKPTPATGMHRYTVMKRISELSKLRNTNIQHSGGHGVITALTQENNHKENDMLVSFSNDEQVKNVYNLPWQSSINNVTLNDASLNYRLGINLVNGSDFESFDLFDAPERGWLYAKEAMELNSFGASGQHSLSITIADKQPQLFGMQSFKRVYKASNPMTIKTKLKSKKVVKASFYWQGRKKRQKLFDAFKNSPKHLIKTIEINNQDNWQNIEVDFNSPRIGYKSYRVLVEFELLNSNQKSNANEENAGTKGTVDIDDFSVIEWQTAFSNALTPQQFKFEVSQASFIGIDRQGDHSAVLTY